MDLFEIVILYLQIAKVLSRRRHVYSSEESIENLLYYKDCLKPTTSTTLAPQPSPVMLRNDPPPPPPCPYPKMCCSLSCNNECGGNGNGFEDYRSQRNHQRPNMNSPLRTKPDNPFMSSMMSNSMSGLSPMISRRIEPVFTKEKIKSLISQDGDIRKILKDLVRVTMQKVDLMEILKRRSGNVGKVESESDDLQ